MINRNEFNNFFAKVSHKLSKDIEDCGYRFRVNPDGSMHVVRFDIEEGLIMDKKDMVNINSNLLSDLLHHIFSRKKIYA